MEILTSRRNIFRFFMKRTLLLSSVLGGMVLVIGLLPGSPRLMAQATIGWISSQTIMDKLPEAQEAQRQLDAVVHDWQNELTKMQNEWQKKYDDYDKKKLILTDQGRAAAEKELQELDKKIGEFRTRKFGQNGEMFVKQNEFMKPVQDKVFKAIQDVAKEEGYDYVFDKSGEILLMYTSEKYDLTQKVLERLKVFTR